MTNCFGVGLVICSSIQLENGETLNINERWFNENNNNTAERHLAANFNTIYSCHLAVEIKNITTPSKSKEINKKSNYPLNLTNPTLKISHSTVQ